MIYQPEEEVITLRSESPLPHLGERHSSNQANSEIGRFGRRNRYHKHDECVLLVGET